MLVILVLLLLVALLFGLYRYLSIRSDLRVLQSSFESKVQLQFEQWKQTHEKEVRNDAVARSMAVTIGKVAEHVAPFLPEFTYNPKDARFIGSPLDFIVLTG